jgi:hypothetical protein
MMRESYLREVDRQYEARLDRIARIRERAGLLADDEGTDTRGGGENHSTERRTGPHRASGETDLGTTGGSARRRVPAATSANKDEVLSDRTLLEEWVKAFEGRRSWPIHETRRALESPSNQTAKDKK